MACLYENSYLMLNLEKLFPSDWNRANVVPIHKKGDRQTVSNYKQVSLLPVLSKVFERLIYNAMF